MLPEEVPALAPTFMAQTIARALEVIGSPIWYVSSANCPATQQPFLTFNRAEAGDVRDTILGSASPAGPVAPNPPTQGAAAVHKFWAHVYFNERDPAQTAVARQFRCVCIDPAAQPCAYRGHFGQESSTGSLLLMLPSHQILTHSRLLTSYSQPMPTIRSGSR